MQPFFIIGMYKDPIVKEMNKYFILVDKKKKNKELVIYFFALILFSSLSK